MKLSTAGESEGRDPDGPPVATAEQWIPAAYLPLDAPHTGFFARCEHLNALWCVALRDDVLDALASRQRAVCHCRFDWNLLPAPFDAIYGAAHGFDLPLLFGNFGPSLYANIAFSQVNRPGRLALSAAMVASLGAFAHRGDPNHAALGQPWQPWPASLVFDATPDALRISTLAGAEPAWFSVRSPPA